MTKQCKALELCDELLRAHRSLAEVQIDYDIEHIRDAITDMQDQHETELATAGEWVRAGQLIEKWDIAVNGGYVGEKRMYFTTLRNVPKSYPFLTAICETRLEAIFEVAAKAEPPAPPIVQPEPEIEVPDLDPGMHFGVDSDTFACCNEAHKAAMRPVLQEVQALKARISELESRVSE